MPDKRQISEHGVSVAGTATGASGTRPGRAPRWLQAMRARRARRSERQRGQILVLYVLAFFVMLGTLALVVDVAWYWSSSLRVQRAADAAALAGAVDLPGDQPSAYSDARNEAAKNGYTDGLGGVSVTPQRDPTDGRRLIVTIQAPIATFFMRVFGLSTITANRSSDAEFVLPVPMGSPENYYGVFGQVRNATMSTTTYSPASTTSPSSGYATGHAWYPNGGTGNWTNPSRANGTSDTNYAVSPVTDGSIQEFGTFNLTFNTPVVSIDGITVRERAFITGLGTPITDCELLTALSSDGGTTYTPDVAQVLTTTKTLYTIGTDLWGRSWSSNDLANGNFRVRLTWSKPGCNANRTVSVDTLEVSVAYTYSAGSTSLSTATYDLTGPGTPCVNGAANCFDATPAGGGQALTARGFWGEMNSEGSANINGDAYMPYYDTPTSVASPACPQAAGRACYGPTSYYNYGITMPAGTTGGYVYVYDPVFCATSLDSGTGDRWYSGSSSVSSFYQLYDMNNTPYDNTDDTLIADSGNEFQQIAASDATMGGSGGSDCRQSNVAYGDGRDYHDAWYLLNPGNPLTGGPDGTTYRLHTTTTDPSSTAQQRNTNAEQNFAIYATDDQAPNTYPQVFGLGAMQMFTPLSANGSATQSEFYLAQIDAVHAGKTLEIGLWDPGDTAGLSAYLEFLEPTAGGWTPATVTYKATVGTTNSGAYSACASNSGSGVTQITTATSSTALFNGCWLTIDIVIPSDYTAPQDGWWKIRYTMNGSGTSSDVTTWTAEIQGNPVHLVYH